jgi:5-methylcytosine-specific restriction protein A
MRKVLRRCVHPGCVILVTRGLCRAHAKSEQRERDLKNGSPTSRGYNSKWVRASKAFLREHPLCACEQCMSGQLRVTPATVVDHIRPHKGDQKLFWDKSNWQAMAKRCHDRKTALHDGALGLIEKRIVSAQSL